MRQMKKLKFETRCFLLSIPAFLGLLLFSVIPFFRSVYYSFIDNVFSKQFVFFENYRMILQNKYFQLALKNTLLFSIVGVVVILLLSFVIAIGLTKLSSRWSSLKAAFTLPMLLPTASIIFAWQILFQTNQSVGGAGDVLPILLLYLWKNTGINVILFTAAFAGVPKELYEAASLDGARSWTQYRKITIPLILPTVFFVFILSLVNSLKVFKESFLFFGTNYPPDAVYTLQYYMNNHFYKLNYQNLSTGVVIFTAMVSVIIFIFYKLENDYTRKVF